MYLIKAIKIQAKVITVASLLFGFTINIKAFADDAWNVETRSILIYSTNNQQPDYGLRIVQDTAGKKIVLLAQFEFDSKECHLSGYMGPSKRIIYINKQGISMDTNCGPLRDGIVIQYEPTNEAGLSFLINKLKNDAGHIEVQIGPNKPFNVPTRNFKEAFGSIIDKVL